MNNYYRHIIFNGILEAQNVLADLSLRIFKNEEEDISLLKKRAINAKRVLERAISFFEQYEKKVNNNESGV